MTDILDVRDIEGSVDGDVICLGLFGVRVCSDGSVCMFTRFDVRW